MEFHLQTRRRRWTPLFVLLVLNCFCELFSVAQFIPVEEAKIMDTIAMKLQYREPIERQCKIGTLHSKNGTSDSIVSHISCNCSLDSTTTLCHITKILLKTQSLAGGLPTEFLRLPYLQEIDLTYNYISGPIPENFSQFRNLKILALLGNRLNGTIPDGIGNISTLEELVLENNQFGGHLPKKLGSLSNLRRLLLSANYNLNGSIPETFANLTNLEDFRIDGTQLSGKIPDFVGNWTKITRLYMQGTSMKGPIPSNIAKLKNLDKLLISDLRGSSTPFPNLQGMKNVTMLVLRNCLITGRIPTYIWEMTNLKTLDLSFNQLTGPVQEMTRENLQIIFLSNNSLDGELPDFKVLGSKKAPRSDLSYNNFTTFSPLAYACGQTQVNLISSLSSNSVVKLDQWCLKKDLRCPKKPPYHSLFINCGGLEESFESFNFERDDANINFDNGASGFFPKDNWALSSTGVFLNNESAKYMESNTSNVSGSIYQTARTAPISLKYYGLCLRNGSYKVRLYFAEIMFSGDKTFRSLGRRIFNVAIQGNLVLENFNIAENATGVNKGIFVDFDNVTVTSGTLEIHLYWAGKGTAAIPNWGVYGPLISAIAVTPNYKVDSRGLSVGAIIGIVLASCVVILLILVVLRMKGYLGGNIEDKELQARALELQTGYFTLRQIKAATKNFDTAYKIGEGGFGSVYKGALSNGTLIAVKQLSSKSKQGNREFINEIGMISALQHPNLVKLYGCCIEGNQLLVIYEYMENNCLARALFGSENQLLNLDWSTRKKICLDMARGLAYLHEETRLKIVHRDIKATNVLLDKDMNAKISDFGLAKLVEEENTHISKRIAGTRGYMAPEYATRGHLTDKADVYSFGVVVLEVVSGKSYTNYRPEEEFVDLLDWAYVLHEQGNVLEIVDPGLGSNYTKEEAMRMLNLALLCTNPSPSLRPSMSAVISMLEGKIKVEAPIVKRSLRFKAFERLSQDSHTNVKTFSQDGQVLEMDSSIFSVDKGQNAGDSSSSKPFLGDDDI